MRRIFLVGLPGSGKSVVGQEVARILGWNFLDTDDLLADRVGMPTGEVLVKYGEKRFRQIETEVLVGASEQECVVVATGGGIVIAEANRTFMREHGLVICLRVSVETAWQRVQEHLRESETKAVRPLLKSTEARDRTYKLLRYQAKQSIQEMVLISQYVQHVEVITRAPSGWEYQEYGHEERFTLASLNVTIHVSEIYRRLSIPIEKRTLMPLEIIEPADEQEDSHLY